MLLWLPSFKFNTHCGVCQSLLIHKHRICLNREFNGKTLTETKQGFDYKIKLANGF